MAKKNQPASLFPTLSREIEEAHECLDKLPDDHEWTLDDLDWLDDMRSAARKLMHVIDATVEELAGKPVAKD